MGFRDQLKAKLGSLTDGASAQQQQQQQQPIQRPPPPIPQATRPGGQPASSAPSGRPFVVVSRGQLALEDGTPFRFAGLNAPELLDGHAFEVEDTFRTLLGFGRRVTRSYTLKIRGTSPHFGDAGHINGWDAQKGDWMYDEGCFVKLDKVLALAEQYDVRLIIPVLGQDFGSANNNWVGNFVDLVRYRKNPSWDYMQAKKNVDFFTDREMIDATKLIFTFLLNRVNTITGRRYGDDPSILAWETGNELQHNFKGNLPAPGDWTVEIARHIRSLAPKTLIMDGSFAKEDIDRSYPSEVLKGKDVDLLSYHYYGNGDCQRAKKEAALAKKHGKVLIIGEYGFLDSANDYAMYLSNADAVGIGGSLVWSLRPHATGGGFKTHREDESNCAYHVPGWPSTATPAGFNLPSHWDKKENQVVEYIRHASFAINNEPVPRAYMVPGAPHVWKKDDGSLSWRGAAWANCYEVWLNLPGNGQDGWQCVAQGVLDAVPEGKTHFAWPHGTPPQGSTVMMRGMAVDGAPGDWSKPLTV